MGSELASRFVRQEVPFEVALQRYEPDASLAAVEKIAADDAGFDTQVYYVFVRVLLARGQGYDPEIVWPIFIETYEDFELNRFSDQSLLYRISTILTNMGYE